jgi:glutamine cyclotransferase
MISRSRLANSKIACLAAGAALALLAGCDSGSPPGAPSANATNAGTVQPPPQSHGALWPGIAPSGVPEYTYEVVHTWPHDRGAFTQGLLYLNGALLESTGLNGQSSLRKVELETGKVLQRVDVPTNYFAEGLALLGNKLFQLTWQNGKGFVYDLDTFHLEKEFYYSGEGWGLTTDGHVLIMSDGTAQIRFLDPETFGVERVINVTANDQPIPRLNELEYVKGEILANVWKTAKVVRIDPATGKVVGEIDFTGLLAPGDYTDTTDVLNGIAYDAAGDRLFITGKCWPKLFEVRLKPK